MKSAYTPAFCNAETVSPPPLILTNLPSLDNSATTFATEFVPLSNGATSNTPSGPFQITVLHFLTTSINYHKFGYWITS